MNCQDARALFPDLLEAAIGLTERVPLEAHLRQCETCQHELEALRTSERPRPPAWRPNLDFATKALDRLRPAAGIPPRGRSVHARPGAPWWPRHTVDLVGEACQKIGRLDIINRLRRLFASLDARARRLAQTLDVARQALESVQARALALWMRWRAVLHLRPRQLRLPAAVILVALIAVGLVRFRADLDATVRRWVPSAPSTAEAPSLPRLATTEPATRPELPQVSAPATTVPAPAPLSRLTVPAAPETPASVTAPVEGMKGSSRPAERAKPAQLQRPPQRSTTARASQRIAAPAPPKVKAGGAAPAGAPPASRDTRPSLDVVGRLQVKSRSGAERDLVALLARAGGTTVGRQQGTKVTVIEAAVPHRNYDRFAAGLTRIGSWQIEAGRAQLPDPVRVTVRLAE
jgi:hypothetical protein